MQHEEQKLSRHAPTMLLALLLTILLGGAGSAAASAAGSTTSFKPLHGGQIGDVVRSLRRVSDEESDADAAPILTAAGPDVETIVASRRPTAQGMGSPSVFQARLRPAAFRARAPPAS